MLAVNHVTLATAVALGGSLYLGQSFFLPFLSFVVFAALLPDIDHPGSEISRTFPLINKTLPHRGVTHSLVGVMVFAAGMYLLLGQNLVMSLILLVAAFIGVNYAEKVLERRVKQLKNATGGFFSNSQIKSILRLLSGILNVFLLILVFLIWKERFRLEILVLLVLGYAAHILGDFVTKEGVPVFWPVRKKIGLRLFRTGSSVEVLLGVLLLLLNGYLLWQFVTVYDLSGWDYWSGYLTLS